ncbi:Aureobasidin resistance protein Aur1 [Mortierella sp. AD011]|nr:Aureobasidin resistance protein Aur1 [Mortierella sp. AD010]KAF9401421.1 Aureobasidin resistance protein Aur1 [Mortierella sp. AD011]
MVSFSNLRLRCDNIQTSIKAAVISTIRPLQKHHYTLYDLQYVFLFILFSFCYYIMEKPVWFKLPIALGAIGLLIPKKTRQFMLPFLAIAAWLILFYCCRFIPSEWRPHIFTSVLPTLENILYGGNISEMLAQTTSPVKDLLAWMPYGVIHFALPFITAILIVFFGPPGTLPVFARTFGYMNLAGVLTQLFFPCAPPWYETSYGSFEPATYAMPGSPGGLARVDDILGLDMYKSTFTASPLVFGAFPSLHSACAWQLAFFLVFIFGPRSIPFVVGYVFWIWWATMYLGHHYVVDLVGGAGYAVVAFWIGSFFLPSVLPQYHNEKAAHVIHDLGDAMNYQEKQTLFDTAHDDDFVGYRYNKEWNGNESEDRDEEFEEIANMVVVKIEQEMEERTFSQSEPSSPSSPAVSKKSEQRQTWSGWHGYESWMEVLATVNTPRSSPRHTPSSSPRGSFAHGYSGRPRNSRESMYSTSSTSTLNLDLEANIALVQGSSSLSVIEEAAGSSGHGINSIAMGKGRSRPSRLVLEGSTAYSGSMPNSPLADHAETDSESSRSGSSRPTSPRSVVSRPTTPRSFVSGALSPAVLKRVKDE